MRYLGGKSKIARRLAAPMLAARGGRPVWEPFCGGLGMSAQWGRGPLVLSDACAPLIALYQAFANGWVPPPHVTPAERDAALALPDSDPLKAFARFGCGFGGDWQGAAANDGRDWNGDSFAQQSARSLARTFAKLPLDVEFMCLDFVATEPFQDAAGFLIYCDPPYGGAEDYYAAVPRFDRAAFLERVRQWAALGTLVFVSEFDLPIGELVWSAERARHMPAKAVGRKARGEACERLYRIAA